MSQKGLALFNEWISGDGRIYSRKAGERRNKRSSRIGPLQKKTQEVLERQKTIDLRALAYGTASSRQMEITKKAVGTKCSTAFLLLALAGFAPTSAKQKRGCCKMNFKVQDAAASVFL